MMLSFILTTKIRCRQLLCTSDNVKLDNHRWRRGTTCEPPSVAPAPPQAEQKLMMAKIIWTKNDDSIIIDMGIVLWFCAREDCLMLFIVAEKSPNATPLKMADIKVKIQMFPFFQEFDPSTHRFKFSLWEHFWLQSNVCNLFFWHKS